MFQICRHIMTNGEQCRSPRLRDAEFCYFHKRLRTQHRAAVRPKSSTITYRPVMDSSGNYVSTHAEPEPQGSIEIGLLEDRASVQMAISSVVNALASNRLDVRRASALLYGLQLASSNCAARRSEHSFATEPVEEVSETEDGDELAPEGRVPASMERAQTWSEELAASCGISLIDIEEDRGEVPVALA